MNLLDLYCGAGGAAMGYHRAGFSDITGIDINHQPNFPFTFIKDDALNLPLNFLDWTNGGYVDFIHASPPCQKFTRKQENWGRKRTYFYDHQDLITPTREILRQSGLPYLIENVIDSPLDSQLMLCGTMFGLRIIKHRIFEANWQLPPPPAICDHSDVYNPWKGQGRSAAKHRAAQDTPWIPQSGGDSRKRGHTGDVFNALPPAYTEYIGKAFLASLEK